MTDVSTLTQNLAPRWGNWLISTLVWLPLLLPMLALWQGRLPLQAEVSAPNYALLYGGLTVAWLLTGLLGGFEGRAAIVIAGVASIGLSLWTLNAITAFDLSGGAIATFFVALIIVDALTYAAAAALATGVTFGAAGGRALVAVGVLAFVIGVISAEFGIGEPQAANILNPEPNYLIGGFMGVMSFGFMMGLLYMLGRMGLELAANPGSVGDVGGLVLGAVALFVAAHGFIIWFFFFDGWRVIQGG